jgi:hypothetical protein
MGMGREFVEERQNNQPPMNADERRWERSDRLSSAFIGG